MEEFIAEQISVQQAQMSPRPVRFTWRGRDYLVAAVLGVWVDTGFGDLPPRSRKWYNRRHRRHYLVKDQQDRIFEIYLDYANRRKPSWWLLKRIH